MDESQFRCCCGTCHVRVSIPCLFATVLQTGALIIAVLMLITALASLIEAANGSAIATSILGMALSTAVAVLLIMGVQRKRPLLLFPAMVALAMQILLFLIIAGTFLIGAAVGSVSIMNYAAGGVYDKAGDHSGLRA